MFPDDPVLSVTIAPGHKGDPLELAGPVIAAAGTMGTGVELQRDLDYRALGAIVTPGIGRAARPARDSNGDPAPLVRAETAAGLLLAEQFPTIACRRTLRDLAPAWSSLAVPVIANVVGRDADECVEVATALADADVCAALEIDLTTIETDGADMIRAIRAISQLLQQLRTVWHHPLIAKLAPSLDEAPALAHAAREAGADAISLGGGFPGAALVTRVDGRLQHVLGLLVGPATKPMALRTLSVVASAAGLPVIASGGVASAEDAVDFLLAGASAIQVGSASLVDPRAALTIAMGITTVLRRMGERDVRNLIGAGHRGEPE